MYTATNNTATTADNTTNTVTSTIATAAWLDEDIVVINDINTGNEMTLLHHSNIDIAVAPNSVLIVDYHTEYVEDWETGQIVPQHTLVEYSNAI